MNSDERAELVRRLFSLMAAKLEDAASEAVDGQGGGQSNEDQVGRAERVEVFIRDVGLLAEAAAAILRSGSSTS